MKGTRSLPFVPNSKRKHPQVADWFLGQPGEGTALPVCRVKNKFALDSADLVGGYR